MGDGDPLAFLQRKLASPRPTPERTRSLADGAAGRQADGDDGDRPRRGGRVFRPASSHSDLTRPFFAVLLLATTVLISVPLGGLVSMVISRELEGALALLSIMALQLLVDPSDAWAKALPLWSTRELTSVAIGVEGAGDATGGILHFTATMGICLLLAWTANAVRLRPVPIPPPSPDPPALGSVE